MEGKAESNIISESKDKDKSDMEEIQNVPSETKVQDKEENIKTKSEDATEPDKENKLIEAVVNPLLSEPEEETTFRVIYNKNKYDVSFPLNMTVMQLKSHLQNIIGVPQAMQKVMIKGLAKDEKTLKELGVSKASKIMVVGSKLDDVLAVSTPGVVESTSDSSSSSTKEPFCKQKMHRRVLDKGIPDDVMPGIRNLKESLPQHPLTGMLNKAGGKVRLTFKLELDQLWIGSKERTEKIPMASIKLVVSEPIENHEQYHILALQLGPTEASRYWVYWVPAQYVEAIKDAILGAWSM